MMPFFQNFAVIDRHVPDAVIEIVTRREHVVRHGDEGRVGHIRRCEFARRFSFPVRENVFQFPFGFFGNIKRLCGARRYRIEFLFQPFERKFGEDLTGTGVNGRRADDQFFVSDRDRQIFENMLKSERTAKNDRLVFRFAITFRQKNGSVRFDLRHFTE